MKPPMILSIEEGKARLTTMRNIESLVAAEWPGDSDAKAYVLTRPSKPSKPC